MKMPMDTKEIMEYIPHRYPFLLVDRILELVPNKKVVGIKNVTMNEPFFQGHFPGAPIMPGVLIVEAMAQAGGVLAAVSANQEKKDTLMYFMGLDQVKFRKPVVPGDQLVLEVEVRQQRAKVMKLAGVAKVDGKVVTEAHLMATMGIKK